MSDREAARTADSPSLIDPPQGPRPRPALPVELAPGPLMLALLDLAGDGSHDEPLDPGEADARMLDARRHGWDALPDRVKLRCRMAIGPRVDPDHFRLILGGVDFKTKAWKLPAAEAPDVEAAAADPLAGLVSLDKLADVAEVEPLARAAFVAGKLGMLFGPSGGGKTTFASAAVAAVSTGAEFIGLPTVDGGADVLVMAAEDTATLRAVVSQMGGDPARVHVWSDGHVDNLPAALERTGARAVLVDTLSEYAHQHGLERNSDDAMGKVARQLHVVAKSTGAAVTILHHEPWSQPGAEQATAGRPKGAGDVYTACDWAARVTVDEWKRETTVTRSKGRRGLLVESIVFLMGDDGFEPGPDHPIPTGGSNAPVTPADVDRVVDILERAGKGWDGELPEGRWASCELSSSAVAKEAIGGKTSEPQRRHWKAAIERAVQAGRVVRRKVKARNGHPDIEHFRAAQTEQTVADRSRPQRSALEQTADRRRVRTAPAAAVAPDAAAKGEQTVAVTAVCSDPDPREPIGPEPFKPGQAFLERLSRARRTPGGDPRRGMRSSGWRTTAKSA